MKNFGVKWHYLNWLARPAGARDLLWPTKCGLNLTQQLQKMNQNKSGEKFATYILSNKGNFLPFFEILLLELLILLLQKAFRQKKLLKNPQFLPKIMILKC